MVAFKTNKTQKTPEKVYFFTSEESCFPTQRIMLPWRHKVSALWLVRWRTVDLFSITSWNLTLLTSLRITHTYLASLLAGGWLFFRLFWTSWSSGIGSERKLETPPARKLGFFTLRPLALHDFLLSVTYSRWPIKMKKILYCVRNCQAFQSKQISVCSYQIHMMNSENKQWVIRECRIYKTKLTTRGKTAYLSTEKISTIAHRKGYNKLEYLGLE